MKKIFMVAGLRGIVKVFKNLEMREYICRLYVNGKAKPEADFFTDCPKIAITTARQMV